MSNPNNQEALAQVAQYFARTAIVYGSLEGTHLSNQALGSDETEPAVLERIIKNVSEKANPTQDK